LRDAAPMLDAPMMAEGEHASLLRDTRG